MKDTPARRATKTEPLEQGIEAARMEEVLAKLSRTAPGRAVEFCGGDASAGGRGARRDAS